MRRLVLGALITLLLALGAYFAAGPWHSDAPATEPRAGVPWHLELRPVNEDPPLPACGRPPYRPCAKNGDIVLREGASTP